MSGNPVRIRDGSATVKGYKLPMPLMQIGKAGARSEAPSQDTGSIVLVGSTDVEHFSAKRRMRPAD
jgi:hypothetical protein